MLLLVILRCWLFKADVTLVSVHLYLDFLSAVEEPPYP